jgi:hypothetical protein
MTFLECDCDSADQPMHSQHYRKVGNINEDQASPLFVALTTLALGLASIGVAAPATAGGRGGMTGEFGVPAIAGGRGGITGDV